NRVCRENGLTRIGCWDHARRKFVEASKAAPVKKKGTKVSKADVAIGKIRKLYAIEKRIEKLPPEEKTRQRQQLAQPVLDDLKAWLEKNSTRVPRDSLTYKAIQYTLNQWELLIGYLADGRLNISNALAENAIRPFAVGRRNWLFADTPRGAKASATVYSLIETAKANGLEPFAYIHHVLQHIGGASTVQACLRPRDRFWDIPVPKIDSAFDNLFVPQPSWSPSTTQQLRKLVAAPYLAPNDWTPRSEAYFVFPLAQGTPGKQCGLAATGVYQPSLRSPCLAAEEIEALLPWNVTLSKLQEG
ncbi:IS66 family transposase, partial [Thiolapillus sp.]|uniref:IS66 family transposase n=6 Tax=Thiolapillus sp. TaxID=2017437 RepID=UPI003AF76CBD